MYYEDNRVKDLKVAYLFYILYILMESLLCFDLELHNQEILGIGGLPDCGMVFSLANKNARENA